MNFEHVDFSPIANSITKHPMTTVDMAFYVCHHRTCGGISHLQRRLSFLIVSQSSFMTTKNMYNSQSKDSKGFGQRIYNQTYFYLKDFQLMVTLTWLNYSFLLILLLWQNRSEFHGNFSSLNFLNILGSNPERILCTVDQCSAFSPSLLNSSTMDVTNETVQCRTSWDPPSGQVLMLSLIYSVVSFETDTWTDT